MLSTLFMNIRDSIKGEAAQPPNDYNKVISSIIAFVIKMVIVWQAGAFAEIIYYMMNGA